MKQPFSQTTQSESMPQIIVALVILFSLPQFLTAAPQDLQSQSLRHHSLCKGFPLPSTGMPHNGDSPLLDRADSLHSYDALSYDATLQIFHEDNQIEGHLDMQLRILEVPCDTIMIHLKSLEASNFHLDDAPCPTTRDEDQLYFHATSFGFLVGDTVQLSLDFGGTPYTGNSLGIFITSQRAYTVSDPWGTRNWMPCYDDPDDKALWNLEVRADSSYNTLANGDLVDTIDHGDGTRSFCYEHNVPMSTYLLSVVSGNYEVINSSWGELPLTYLVYPSHVSIAETAFSRVDEMFNCFTGLWGEYPFSSYAMGEAPIYGGYGGMEHQTCTTIGNGIVAGGLTYESVVAHELSHQWWGDALTPVDFRHVWLNEGWATYAEALYAQHLAGGDWDAFLEYMDQIHSTYLGWDSAFLPIYAPPLSQLFNISQYEKAASVIHMLRFVVGEQCFHDSQRQWYEEYAYATVDTWDYLHLFEETSGQDLEWFFDQWIFTGGYPTYHTLVESREIDDRYLVHLSVSQSHPNAVDFTMPVPVSLEYNGGVLDTTITVTGPSTQVTWNLPVAPDTLIFNKDDWILCRHFPMDPPDSFDLELQAYAFDDTQDGNGDGDLEPGESAQLELTFQNLGGWQTNLQFQLSSDDLTLSGSWDPIEEVGYGSIFTLPFSSLILHASEDLPESWVTLHLDVFSEEEHLESLDFEVFIGSTWLLLVNDDPMGANESHWSSELDSLRVPHHHWRTSTEPLPPELTRYKCVLWFTGNIQGHLDSTEAALLETWQDAGISMMLSGQDLLDSLDHGVSYALTGAQVLNPDIPSIQVGGEVDSHFEGLTGLLIGSYGAQNQQNPSVLATSGLSQPVFHYLNGGEMAGVAMESQDIRILTLGFGLEGVSGMANTSPRRAFLDQSLAWLMDDWIDLPSAEGTNNAGPCSFHLETPAPNPFNNQSTVTLRLTRPQSLRITLHNLLGQQVAEISAMKEWTAGDHRVRIHGDALASGNYYLKAENGEKERQVIKLQLLK
jgi:hypothetical protein